MAKTTEKYEVLYVLNPNLTEEETQAIVEKFKTLIEQNGTVDEMPRSLRALARSTPLTSGASASSPTRSTISPRATMCW